MNTQEIDERMEDTVALISDLEKLRRRLDNLPKLDACAQSETGAPAIPLRYYPSLERLRARGKLHEAVVWLREDLRVLKKQQQSLLPVCAKEVGEYVSRLFDEDRQALKHKDKS